MLQFHINLENTVSRAELLSLLAESFGLEGNIEDCDWSDLVDPIVERLERLNARSELVMQAQGELIERAPEEILALSECVGLINKQLKDKNSKARIGILWEY
jgi:hypothetical protein